jgi:hypothetical protein
MAPKSGALDQEIADMLELYQAAATRSDSYVSARMADPSLPLRSGQSVAYRPISAAQATSRRQLVR